ncbi:MAG: FecR domain-containing protein [Candidatus Omnitrophica bacterium]|nr:FecR domain-containing protein [Candidatus Omnitrophota bacterium]
MKKIIFIFNILFAFICTLSFAQELTEEVFIYSVNGNVKLIASGSNVGVPCEKGMKVHPLDWIKTGPDSSAVLAFDKDANNILKIEEDSLVILKMDGYFKAQLLKGQVYALLENVEKDDTFRMLTPSVVTEAKTSAWGINNEGVYTSVMVLDGEAYVCGVNKDGSVKKDKYKIPEGMQRTTKRFEDPGVLNTSPEEIQDWFKDQVIKHHMSREISKQTGSQQSKLTSSENKRPKTLKGKNITIVDDQEVDILDYIYKDRLSKK